MEEDRPVRVCQICGVIDDDDEEEILGHNSTKKHRFNYLLYIWNQKRKSYVKDRNGVELNIVPRQQNGYLYNYHTNQARGKHCLKITPEDLLTHNNTLEFSCTVKNIQNRDSIMFTNAQLLHPYTLYSLYDPEGNIGGGKYLELESGASYSIIVQLTTPNALASNYKIPICFSFQSVGKDPQPFYIVRAIVVIVEEHNPEDKDATKSPFTNYDWHDNVHIHPPTQIMRYSNNYTIPPEYYKFLKFGLNEYTGMDREAFLQLRNIRDQLHPGYVTKENYQKYWHIVLWLEEMGQTLMLKRYNMENVKMNLIADDRLELEVPGLAEKRPSVIVGDMIDIRVHEDHTGYRGVIKCVNDKTVDVAFVDEELCNFIEVSPDIELDVRFTLGRLALERMHQGIDQTIMNGMVSSLFPDYTLRNRLAPQTIPLQNSEFRNQMVVTNLEQKTAVVKILNASSMSAPYIVFGPPGTGKTVTIVEALLQIKMKTKKRILVCAPANAACDMLTEKLMPHCSKKELIRIMSESVDRQTMNMEVLDYSNCDRDGVFTKLLAQELMQYRIVVTTLILIGKYNTKYHPDVVFIDEAAQACEPEVTCAIGMIQKGKQVILAGDPKQLGPSTSSKVAEKYGLGKSLLERLMGLDLYKSEDPNFITMLKLNFRSHSKILELPNELFYGNQLQPISFKSENDPIARVCIFHKIQQNVQSRSKSKSKKVKELPPGQAVEFCSVLSKECRQGRSPSYFNNREMEMVLKYVQALTALVFEDEEHKVLPEQIGIVTPYIRQVYKIRMTLRNHNFEGVEVGTTETFQGREKRIIIISTVRAQHDLLLYDKKYNLGFVSNEKRFNVAITRAMSKLIIIGCAHVLASDAKWSRYIKMCEEANVFCGAPFAKRTQAVRDDITERFRSLKINSNTRP